MLEEALLARGGLTEAADWVGVSLGGEAPGAPRSACNCMLDDKTDPTLCFSGGQPSGMADTSAGGGGATRREAEETEWLMETVADKAVAWELDLPTLTDLLFSGTGREDDCMRVFVSLISSPLSLMRMLSLSLPTDAEADREGMVMPAGEGSTVRRFAETEEAAKTSAPRADARGSTNLSFPGI